MATAASPRPAGDEMPTQNGADESTTASEGVPNVCVVVACGTPSTWSTSVHVVTRLLLPPAPAA